MATTDRGVGQRVEDAKEGMNMTTMMTKADRLMKTLCAAVVMVLAMPAASAADLVAIFRQLYDAHYPIARMVLVDEYRADDETSMRANNTSCFCYRTVAGSRKVSAHAMGMAVDINPLYNPYVKRRANGRLFIQPANAEPYTHRERRFDYKIERGDLCHRLFLQHGFSWGGAWRSLKDYQHFEKPF